MTSSQWLSRDELGVILNKGYDPGTGGERIVRAVGSQIEQANGAKYIDTILGCGTCILGHCAAPVVEALSEQLTRGTVYCLPSDSADAYGELLTKLMPWNDHLVFCNSGSEATMRAIRIARAASGKKKIALFSGGWHGSHDLVLFEDNWDGEEGQPAARRLSRGSPEHLLDDVVYLPYNHPNAFSIIEENAADLALVLVEPVQGSNPRDDIKPFLAQLREVTRQCDVLLGFDEVITGGRLGLGGGQKHFDVYGDIATYGKVLGGGIPVGIVGGRHDVMKTVLVREPGGTVDSLFLGGTFSGNPMAMVAGRAVLSHLADNEVELYGRLHRQGEHLRGEVNRFCEDRGIGARMMGVESVSRIVFTRQKIKSRHQRNRYEWNYGAQGAFFDFVKEQGVLVGGNRILFLSTAHTDAEVERIIEALTKALEYFAATGAF